MHFECLKCCDCCKNLLHNKHGWVTALSLLPEETYLFPPEHVFPQSGIGGYGSVKRIMTYQLDLDMCPNLQGQECVIYDKRPLTCQVYPFLLEKMQPLRLTVDEHCRWFREEVIAMGLAKKVLTSKEGVTAPKETEACLKLFERLEEYYESRNKWRFDLGKRAWFHLRETSRE